MGRKSRIDWCDATWNPVTGCLHGCEYCYAEKIAKRFGGHMKGTVQDIVTEDGCIERRVACLEELNHPYRACTYQDVYKDGSKGKPIPYPFDFKPTFHRYRLEEPQHWKEPKNIFVCSMADLFGDWVPEKWIQEVFAACEAAPQHRYLFLTKNPGRLTKMYGARVIRDWNRENPDRPHPQTEEFARYTPLPEHQNWWWGSTVTDREGRFFQGGILDHVFISIEPLMGYLDAGLGSFGGAEWIIAGAETGNRKGKVIPEKAWVDNIVDAAGITHAAVFMKESLREIMGEDFVQEFPWRERG